MRQLIIARHAQAEPELSANKDFARTLTETGCKDAQAAGLFMAAQGLMPQRVIVSPARRTRITYENMCLHANLPQADFEDTIYNAPVERLLSCLAQISDEIASIMLIGHNPGMHALAMYVGERPEQILAFPPATLCHFHLSSGWSDLPHRGARLQNLFLARSN